MKILHTSDWHLGRTLYGRKRYEEFAAFLHWLTVTLAQEQVDVLLVAGDVFDTHMPSHRAQELYYQFLGRVTAVCRHVVLIAGNHDSPSLLNAPKDLLRALHVHVIGAASDKRADEVVVLDQPDGAPELIVCAVPYLRDRDIRVTAAGESVEDKEQKLLDGIRNHYAEVVALAEQKRQAINPATPIIAMGHLFTTGGQTVDGDGVRALYVGSMAHVAVGLLPTALDYLALGHLHVPQKVQGSEVMRYSGSPLPMGFGEARQPKSVCLVEQTEHGMAVRLLPVPVFQALESIRGTWPTLQARLAALVAARSQAWLEIVYEGDEVIGDLRERLAAAVAGSALEILRIQDKRIINQALSQLYEAEQLSDLEVHEVFDRCLTAHQVPEAQRPALCHAYQEILTTLHETDSQAE
ncbi:MAG: exonuclease SbcCD subunit D C-terminal domain-containing protein [Magnetococcales bacterium]|nr:exonuclease SbcCD subunit D C-terminal domain-containing protein [Magnetococcales bacterium]